MLQFWNNNKQNIFVLITFCLLTVSYATNIFNIASDNYNFIDRADEKNVLGRMFLSHEKGIFYKGAITGQYYGYKYTEKELQSDNPPLKIVDSNGVEGYSDTQIYNDYMEDREVYGGKFHPYRSQPGGHAMLYSVLQKISPFNGKINFFSFRLLTIALSALAFALFCGWVYRNFGFAAGLVTFILILLSAWLYQFAFNLWWALWSFYIPFITMLLVLERRKKKGIKMFDNKLILYLAIAVYAKFFFTGAEFITSALVAAMCPIIYYLFLEKSSIKEKIIFFIKASIASCLTVLLGLLQLVMQIRYLDGTWADGFRHVFFSYTKHNLDSSIIHKSRWELLWEYTREGTPFFLNFFPYIKVGFIAIIILTALASVFIWRSKNSTDEEKGKNKALILTTIISLAGPYSWLILFPAHASFHTFLDYVIWYMPYCLFAFAVIGVAFNLIVKRIGTKPAIVKA